MENKIIHKLFPSPVFQFKVKNYESMNKQLTEYIYGLRYEFNPFNIPFALIKSYVFAFLVASISSFQGYYTEGGALEVGKSSTQAVTKSCIAILIADYLLAQILL